MPVTPQLGLNTPVIGSNNWGGPLNFNFTQLDRFLSGQLQLPGLAVNGNVTITGTLTAGVIAGLSGTILTSALFNQPNGIPQLNGAGLIPISLISGQGINVIPFSSTPAFNAALGGNFKITLTGDVTSSTFSNGTQGPGMVMFRIVQDATGGRAFTWPANVRNAGAVSPVANSRSIQFFSLDTDGSLDAAAPMMYS